MHNRQSMPHNLPQPRHADLEADTARWTSPAYDVKFGRVEEVPAQSYEHENFRMSAIGISAGLMELLSDYRAEKLRSSLDHLLFQQNAHVVILLDRAMSNDEFNFEMLDQIFIAIDAELFLPRGLRMHVTCVTNIVQPGDDSQLDKFVAVLDPGEAEKYVAERRGMTFATDSNIIH
mgnify:CR=1 FL=1